MHAYESAIRRLGWSTTTAAPRWLRRRRPSGRANWRLNGQVGEPRRVRRHGVDPPGGSTQNRDQLAVERPRLRYSSEPVGC